MFRRLCSRAPCDDDRSRSRFRRRRGVGQPRLPQRLELAFDDPAVLRQSAASSVASKRRTRMGCVFDARIRPQPSSNVSRTPSTSIDVVAELAEASRARSASWNLIVVGAVARGSPA